MLSIFISIITSLILGNVLKRLLTLVLIT